MRTIFVFLIVAVSWVSGLSQTAFGSRSPMVVIFEPNFGQASESVRFVGHGPGYQVLLSDDHFDLLLQNTQFSSEGAWSQPSLLRLRWLGARPGSRFLGEARQGSKSNYFQGADQTSWHTNIPNFAGVLQESVRPGMDIRFHANAQQQLEYDLRLAPELNASDVGVEVIGSTALRIDEHGQLVMKIGGTELRQPAPHAYELLGNSRRDLDASYVVESGDRVSLSVPDRTPGSELIIDPVLQYSTFLGGSKTSGDFPGNPSSTGVSTAVDALGNVYIVGTTDTINFPTTPGAYEPECPDPGSSAGCAARPVVFVTKFSRSGQLLYATYLSGTYGSNYWYEAGKLITVDGYGNAYVTGGAFGGFPVTNNAYQQDCAFETDSECAFLTKLNADGSNLLYSTYYGNGFPITQFTIGTGLALGPQGDVYIAGWTESSELPTTPGVLQPTCPDLHSGYCQSGFVARFNTKLSGDASLVFGSYLGSVEETGRDVTEADGVAVDAKGSIYVVGITSSNQFPHTAAFGSGMGIGATRGRGVEGGYTFVTKLSPYGKSMLYSTLLRGASGTSIAVDSSGQAFVAGAARSGLATTPGVLQTTFRGGFSDAFITKLSITGKALQYSTFVGGGGADNANDISVNNYGIAFITGTTDSGNFPLATGAFQNTHSGTSAFVTALQNNGTKLYYSTYLGGPHTGGSGITLDPAWNAYVAGGTGDIAFPVTAQAFQSTKHGMTDAFWSKIVIAGDLQATLSPTVTSVAPNGVVNFRGRVTNRGPDGSDNVVFHNPIPVGMSYAGVYSANATTCSQPSVGATTGTLTCRKDRLESGQTLYVNVYLRAIAAKASTLQDTGSASAQTQDLRMSNNTARATVQVH